jgi:hypothetical protein
MHKYVVSTGLKEPLAWNNSQVIRGDLPTAVRKPKDEPGQHLLIFGAG